MNSDLNLSVDWSRRKDNILQGVDTFVANSVLLRRRLRYDGTSNSVMIWRDGAIRLRKYG